ncbi:B12-binding domain-containing radical SAM protein [Selenomonas sp. oral taxon 126]|uniref:TIGR03960 family B12-binding radical SAM protein n=1 Tax=Selenomonas sp. oral taxon 126 TaxID=712528 RepID=UPI0008079F55|nr:TIGR03960 family B12-binding radical SAM protein [Selenomonas sp. oral taxon 126]ANR71140.1 B12-binding domain-containing radical SAM protein [Selenomonas sp. oral taxon 126]
MVQLDHSVLQSVLKPARYTGGEWNAVRKDWDSVQCRFALALPDVYEVGMSNLGLAILYEILNRRADIAAERVYAPWIDMEEKMRARGIPLFSLESRRPIEEFDFIGFSLQYEMIYSNVLNMLDLAGIPLYARERGEDMPFVVGGGPCVYNVEPIADFFDFFVIGEAEEVLPELCDALIAWRAEGRPGGRRGFLTRLLAIDGIYVPAFYEPIYDEAGHFREMRLLHPAARPVIYKRVVRDMDAVMSVEHPIVPYMDIVHNRMMLELFRGCSRGCRFCQAGIAYRPARERTEERLRGMAQGLIASTGYDEMSLTSLSSADYSCLGRLVDDLMADNAGEKISFSLPSLRIDSFSIDLAHRMQQVRKSGLTFAPEAGTQRLRDVINKGVTEENLLTACGAAFRHGWKQVKLYFMMGLPTETDEDIIGIAKLAKKVVDLYTEIRGRRGCKVTVSVSCFVPKPYTPFQWFGQLPIEEFRRRQQLLKEHITDRSITFHYHDARLSVIEGVFARGDRRLAPVLYEAWKNGAKFDGWSDLFDDSRYFAAFETCGVDWEYFSRRTRTIGEPLPWAHTSPGVLERFLKSEWQKALSASLTEDCRRTHCTGCGICPTLGVDVIDYAGTEVERPTLLDEKDSSVGKASPVADKTGNPAERRLFVYRGLITKGEELRYVSHLDYANLFVRACKRAGLPMAYSEGFNPHMKVAFASALSLGAASDAEYVDFEMTEALAPSEVMAHLGAHLPRGAQVVRLRLLEGKHRALMADVDEARYRIAVPYAGDVEAVRASVVRYNAAESAVWERSTPKKSRTIETKTYIKTPVSFTLEHERLTFWMNLVVTSEGSVKPIEVLSVMARDFALPVDPSEAYVTRTGLFADGVALIDRA